jgi:heparin/heparan-sulfate lyase
LNGHSNAYNLFEIRDSLRIYAQSALVNGSVPEIDSDERLTLKKGLTLKTGVAAALARERENADIVIKFKLPKAGRYVIKTRAFTDTEGVAAMKIAKTKFESLFMRIQVGCQRPTNRVLYVPWDVKEHIRLRTQYNILLEYIIS